MKTDSPDYEAFLILMRARDRMRRTIYKTPPPGVERTPHINPYTGHMILTTSINAANHVLQYCCEETDR